MHVNIPRIFPSRVFVDELCFYCAKPIVVASEDFAEMDNGTWCHRRCVPSGAIRTPLPIIFQSQEGESGMTTQERFEALAADFVLLTERLAALESSDVAAIATRMNVFDSFGGGLPGRLTKLENRVAEIEAKVANHKQRGAPSLVEHLKHVYGSLPLTDTGPQSLAEVQRMFVCLTNARRELYGILISLGVDPQDL